MPIDVEAIRAAQVVAIDEPADLASLAGACLLGEPEVDAAGILLMVPPGGSLDTPMGRYVALLRGINVGGNNLIKMANLKACFEALGFVDVATYIQSGNIVFTTGESGAEKLTRRAEAAIAAAFGCASRVVLRSGRQMRDIVARAPAGFGTQPERYRYHVIFLKAPLTAPWR